MNKNSNITTQNQIAINRQFENSVRNLTKVWEFWLITVSTCTMDID
jgi:hypothetical protein